LIIVNKLLKEEVVKFKLLLFHIGSETEKAAKKNDSFRKFIKGRTSG